MELRIKSSKRSTFNYSIMQHTCGIRVVPMSIGYGVYFAKRHHCHVHGNWSESCYFCCIMKSTESDLLNFPTKLCALR